MEKRSERPVEAGVQGVRDTVMARGVSARGALQGEGNVDIAELAGGSAT